MGLLCVSTHDKQDPANGKRSSVQECDHFSPSVRPTGLPETCTPRPRTRDTTRRAKRRSLRRKAPRNPSRPVRHGRRYKVQVRTHACAHAVRACSGSNQPRSIDECLDDTLPICSFPMPFFIEVSR